MTQKSPALKTSRTERIKIAVSRADEPRRTIPSTPPHESKAAEALRRFGHQGARHHRHLFTTGSRFTATRRSRRGRFTTSFRLISAGLGRVTAGFGGLAASLGGVTTSLDRLAAGLLFAASHRGATGTTFFRALGGVASLAFFRTTGLGFAARGGNLATAFGRLGGGRAATARHGHDFDFGFTAGHRRSAGRFRGTTTTSF